MNYDILLSWLAEAEKKLQLLSQCLKVYFSTKKLVSSTVSSSFGENLPLLNIYLPSVSMCIMQNKIHTKTKDLYLSMRVYIS